MNTQSRVTALLLAALVTLTLAPTASASTAKKKPIRKTATVCTKLVADYSYATPVPAQESLTATTNSCRTSSPWVILIHGGSWINGTRANMAHAADEFYARGWQVFNMDYRRGPTVSWPLQLNDVHAALNWVRAHAATFGLDLDEGTLFGFSAGGHMAAFGELFGGVSSIVTGAGVLLPEDVTAPTLAGREADMMGCTYTDAVASPGSVCAVNWFRFEPEQPYTLDAAPMYMIQGDDDPYVPPATPDLFAAILDLHGVAHVVVHVPGLGHDDAIVWGDAGRESAMFTWIVAQF